MYTVNISALILLGFFAIAIGLVIGIMVSALRFGRHARQVETPVVPPPPKDLMDIAHLWRRKRDNNLMVEFELEGMIETASDLSDEQKRRLALVAQDLNRWLGLPQAVSQTHPAVEQALPSGKLATPVSPLAGLVPPSGIPVPNAPAVGAAPAGLSLEKPKLPTGSIASQVNDILQVVLIKTPLEKRGIRLFELPGKGMVVMVGLNQYDSVDEVPEEIIRKVIKLAVQKWEKQMSR
jgi:hypothetical protein